MCNVIKLIRNYLSALTYICLTPPPNLYANDDGIYTNDIGIYAHDSGIYAKPSLLSARVCSARNRINKNPATFSQ